MNETSIRVFKIGATRITEDAFMSGATNDQIRELLKTNYPKIANATIALQVTHSAFPDIYAEAVERLRTGATYPEMDRLLCKAISSKGIPLDDLDMIGWGVPLAAVGIDLEDPEFYTQHSDVLPS